MINKEKTLIRAKAGLSVLSSESSELYNINKASKILHGYSIEYITCTRSPSSAEKLAKFVNGIFSRFLSEKIFFNPKIPVTTKFDTKDLLTLEQVIKDTNGQLPELYVIDDNFHSIKKAHNVSAICNHFYIKSLREIDNYVQGTLKERAKLYNVKLMKKSSQIPFNIEEGELIMSLSRPDSLLYGHKKDLVRFIHHITFSPGKMMKAIYVSPIRIWDFINQSSSNYSICELFLNASHLDTIIREDLDTAELKRLEWKIISSIPFGAENCALVPVPPVTPTSFFHDYKSTIQSGILHGALEGCAEHFGLKALVDNPFYRFGLGYWASGGICAGLSVAGWFIGKLSNRLLRKKSRPGSVRRGCAMVIDGLLIGLPFASDLPGYLVGTLGSVAGKHCAKAALAKVHNPVNHQPKPKIIRPARNRRHPQNARATPVNMASARESLSKLLANREQSVNNSTISQIVVLLEQLQQEEGSISGLSKEQIRDLTIRLPWSEPILGDVIKAHLDNLTDKQSKATYIKTKLDQYERFHMAKESETNGQGGSNLTNRALTEAINQLPGLYQQYLIQTRDTNLFDPPHVNRLWAILHRESHPDLLIEVGITVIQKIYPKDVKNQITILTSPKLSSELQLRTFEQLPLATQKPILFQKGPDFIGKAYLEKVLKTSRPLTESQQEQAILHFLNLLNPSLNDRLIPLVRYIKKSNAAASHSKNTVNQLFCEKLDKLANSEISVFRNNKKQSLTKYLRARAARVALNALESETMMP